MINCRVCRRLLIPEGRYLSTTAASRSGHNRWSKIKHDKAKEDASVTKERSAIAAELVRASKDHGPDIQMNPRLADLVTKAKKIGFPKASIENAIARGQGVSQSGAPLENVTIEAMMPHSVAIIIECRTDSKPRTLTEMRLAIKDFGGTVTPTKHIFEQKGRILAKMTPYPEPAHLFDRVIEAGVIDVQTDGENIQIFTEPSQTTAVANKLVESLGFKIEETNIIWDPKEDMMLDMEWTWPENLGNFLDRIHNDPSVQDVYTNIPIISFPPPDSYSFY